MTIHLDTELVLKYLQVLCMETLTYNCMTYNATLDIMEDFQFFIFTKSWLPI